MRTHGAEWFPADVMPAGEMPADVMGGPASAAAGYASFGPNVVPSRADADLSASLKNLASGGAYTVECWFKTDLVADPLVLMSVWTQSGNQMGWRLRHDSRAPDPNRIEHIMSADGATQAWTYNAASALIAADTWAHFAWTVNLTGNERRSYVNGLPVGTVKTCLASQYVPATPFRLACGNLEPVTTRGGTVGMAEARIWTAVRSPAEILANYNKRMAGTEPNLLACWPLRANCNDLCAGANHLVDTGVTYETAGGPF